jgi:hypothetical protein
MPTLRLGSTAPNFEAETSKGPIKFHEWIGDSWVLLALLIFRLTLTKIYCNPRPSFFRTPMTSPRCALPNSRKSRAVRPILRSAMSRSLGCLRTVSNRTRSGSWTSTSGEKLTSSIPLYVPWIYPQAVDRSSLTLSHRSPILIVRLRRSMICSTTRMRATSTRRAYLLL